MTQQTKTLDARKIIYTPEETGAIGVQYVEAQEANKHRAIPFPFNPPSHPNYVAHLLSGQIFALQAQTSNYKTGLIRQWEKWLANWLMSQGREREVIISVDIETNIEEIAMQEIAAGSGESIADLARGNVQDWGKVYVGVQKINDVRIIRIAASEGKDLDPELHLSNIGESIKLAVRPGVLYDDGLTPAAIFIDYLHALAMNPEVAKMKHIDRRDLQVREDVYKMKRMANLFKAPVIYGSQAKQTLPNAKPNMYIPGTYDGQWSEAIGSRSNRVVSIWMPKTTLDLGTIIKYNKYTYFVTEDLLFIKVNKQRGNLPAGLLYPCQIDHQTGWITPVDWAKIAP